MRQGLSVFGNPSSVHQLGRVAYEAIELARDAVADLLGCSSETLLFTSSGTEANNHLLHHVAYTRKNGQTPHIIISAIEHPSVQDTCRFLERVGAAHISVIPVNQKGMLDLEALERVITSETALVFVMMANNEVGTLQPIQEVGAIAKKYGVLCGTDAVQAVGKLAFSVEELGVDFLTFSAHKLYAPKGVGGIYVKEGIPFSAFIHGGYQEKKWRGGTHNVPGIIGLGKAAQLLKKTPCTDTVHALATRLETGILSGIAQTVLNGHSELRIPGTVNISFPGVSGESLLMALDQQGVAVSTGAACSTGSIEASPVLQAMGVSEAVLNSAIRFSVGQFNTLEEISHVLDILPRLVDKLRV